MKRDLHGQVWNLFPRHNDIVLLVLDRHARTNEGTWTRACLVLHSPRPDEPGTLEEWNESWFAEGPNARRIA